MSGTGSSTASGAPALHPGEEADVELARLPFEQAVLESDAGGGERIAATPGLRARVAQRRNHAGDSCVDEGAGAWRRAPVVAAGLEVHVDRRPLRLLPRVLKSDRFRMRPARALMPAFGDDALAAGDNAADARIRCGRVKPLLGERERPAHHGLVERREHGSTAFSFVKP